MQATGNETGCDTCLGKAGFENNFYNISVSSGLVNRLHKHRPSKIYASKVLILIAVTDFWYLGH